MKKRFVRGVCLIALGTASSCCAMQDRGRTGWLDKLTSTADENKIGLNLAQTKFAFTEINKCCALLGTLPPVLGEQVQARADLIIWDIWTNRYPMITCDCAGAIAGRYFNRRVEWAEKMMDAIAEGDCADAARLLSTVCWAQAMFRAHVQQGGGDAAMLYAADRTYKNIILPLRQQNQTALEKCRGEVKNWVTRTKEEIESWQKPQMNSERVYDFGARELGCASTHPIPQLPCAPGDVFAAYEPDSDEEGKAWKQKKSLEHRTSRALWEVVDGAADPSKHDGAEGVSRFECLTFLSAAGLQGFSELAKKTELQNFVLGDDWESFTAIVVKEHEKCAQYMGETSRFLCTCPEFNGNMRNYTYKRLLGAALRNEQADDLERAKQLRALAQRVNSGGEDALRLREEALQEFATESFAFAERANVWRSGEPVVTTDLVDISGCANDGYGDGGSDEERLDGPVRCTTSSSIILPA